MTQVPAEEGPLSILHTWTGAQQRVCVVTRHAVGVRGRATGTLRGFDRFMNLLLLDVEEDYTVIIKVPRYKGQEPQQQQQPPQQQQQQPGSIAAGGALLGQQQRGIDEEAAATVATHAPGAVAGASQRPDRVRVRWCRKQEHRFRKMEQVLIRGDSVVLLYAVKGTG